MPQLPEPQPDFDQRDTDAKEVRRDALAASDEHALLTSEMVEFLIQSIQAKFDRARASRDQAEMTRQTMARIKEEVA